MSFPLRVVLDLVPPDESAEAAKTRTEKRAWLGERGYRVIALDAREVEADVGKMLDRIDEMLSQERES